MVIGAVVEVAGFIAVEAAVMEASLLLLLIVLLLELDVVVLVVVAALVSREGTSFSGSMTFPVPTVRIK